MMTDSITIESAVEAFKTLIDNSIKEGGNKGKTAMIRSSKPILNIHEAAKAELVHHGVNEHLIYPPIGERTPELKIAGFLKQKDQDICIVPSNIQKQSEVLTEGLLEGVEDEYGEEFTKNTLSINVRSQISSIQKNFDTLYERTISEAQNLHERCPEMVLGEVYMIAVPEYDDKEFANKRSVFKSISQQMVEKYIKSFQAINNRATTEKHFYKYEAVCLLIVRLDLTPSKVYNTTQELIDDGLLSEDTKVRYEGLEWASFVPKLLSSHEQRFGEGILT